MTKEAITVKSEPEPVTEVGFLRRFNLGNFNHKEYEIKISGTDSQIQKQLDENQEKLIGYLTKLESIVEISNEASKLKVKAEVKPNESGDAKPV